MIARLRSLFAAVRREPLTIPLALIAAVLVPAIAFAVMHPVAAPGEAARVFSVTPVGDDVPRLAPVRVSYLEAPAERDGTKLLRLEPSVAGEYLWLDDRTLLFQPEYPGYQRGQQYRVHLAAVAEAGLPSDRVEQFTATGLLRVVQVIPEDREQGVIDGTPILVQFSRGVAPLTTLSEASRAKPVLIFDPPLAGRGEWVNTALYRFTPDSLPPNRRYSVRLDPALSSAADGQLPAPFEWSFETFGPGVVKVTPEINSTFAAPNQPVRLEFNLPMDRASVQRGFSLKTSDGSVATGTFSWENDDRVMVMQPASLRPKTAYTAQLAAGTAARGGGETARLVETTFTTVGPVEVTGTNPTNGSALSGYEPIRISFSNPVDEESFEGKVTISGIPDADVRLFSYGANSISIATGPALKASSSYTVRLAAGATDRYGQPVPPTEFTFTTPPLQPSVSFIVPGAVGQYSTTEDQRIYFSAVNAQEVTFRLYSLAPEVFGSLARRNYITGNFAWGVGDPIREWKETLSAERDQAYVTSTRLNTDGSLGKGYYVVMATLPTGSFQRAEFAFAVTDTAVITKASHDELLVWVLDLASGAPVANAPVRLLTTAGRTATTDANGLAKMPYTKPMNQDGADLVEVNAGGRFGISSLGWRTWFNVAQQPFPRSWVGHLYADRVIFRPGETVELKGVVRSDNDAAYAVPPGSETWTLEVRDPQYQVVARQDVRVNEFGTFAYTYAIPPGAKLGEYRFILNTGGSHNETFASTTVSVIEFRKPEFEVRLDAPPFGIAGDPLSLQLHAEYLFGGGVADSPIRWSATTSPHSPRLTGALEEYSFSDYDPYRPSVTPAGPRASGEGSTDRNGVLEFSLSSALGDTSTPQLFSVSASVSDQTAQAQSATARVVVFPAAVVPGLRPERYVARVDTPVEVRLVTVHPDESRMPNRAATVRVYERTWVTTKERGADGGRYYRSVPVDTLIETIPVTTNGQGEAVISVTPKNSGSLRIVLEATDDRGRVATAATYVYSYGSANASWRYSNDERFDLVADRVAYRVGDTAQVLVPAPYPGAIGLVTIERGKNIRQQVMRFDSNAVMLPIPIGQESVPNIFVSVVLYRPPSGDDPAPRYNAATIDLPVSTDTRKLNVDISTDRDRATPRDRVRYTVRVTDSAGRPVAAELSLAVVDKAVILLADDRGPTGLLAFWFQRGLGVDTSSSLLVLMNRLNDTIRGLIGEGTTKGGDGFASGDPRREFRNTAFWQAQVRTNDRGEATVEVALPDNVTTWRMQARAVTPDARVGESVHELLTTTPLIARPALPRFVRVGDRLNARVVVQNGTTAPMEATVSIAATGVTLTDTQPRRVRIEAGRSAIAEWPVTAGSEERAVFTFSATSPGGAQDSVETTIPVLQAYTPETVATGGIVSEGPMPEALYLPPGAILDQGSLDVTMRQTLAATLSDELDRFYPAPYREYPSYIAARLRTRLGLLDVNRTPLAEVSVNSEIATLLLLRSGQGWTDCSTCRDIDPDVTAQALIALGDAQARGFAVQQDALSEAQSYLRRLLEQPTDVEQPLNADTRAMYLYAVAHAGNGEQLAGPIRTAWDTHRASLGGSGLAYMLMAMEDAGVRDSSYTSARSALIAAAVLTANGAHWEDTLPGNRSGRTILATSLALEALTRNAPSAAAIRNAEHWLGLARIDVEYEPHWETAQYTRAIGSMAAKGSGAARANDVRVTVNGDDVLSDTLDPAKQRHSVSASVPLTSLTPGKINLLQFSRSGAPSDRLLYSVLFRYQMPSRDAEALNRGFAVTREITPVDAPATRIGETPLGSTVRVKVTVVVSGEQRDVNVVDMLPAGLEAIDPKLRTADRSLIERMQTEQRALNQASNAYSAPWMRWYYSPWDSNQIRDDRIEVHARNLPRGVHEFVYLARATTAGTFHLPPTVASVAGMPDVFGRGDSETFTIRP